MDARAVYNKVMNRDSREKITDNEWLEIEKEVSEWLETNPAEDEKKLFTPLGAYEVIGMMAEAVHFKRKTGRYAADYEIPGNVTVVQVKDKR